MANVLLIEPDKVLARAYTQGLAYAGHVVTHVHGAQDAIEAADDQTPDIVVLEPQLSVQDGIAFLQEFRSYSEWQQIPVILNTHLTAVDLAPVRSALERDLGVSVCLYKPQTTLEQLIRAVNAGLASA